MLGLYWVPPSLGQLPSIVTDTAYIGRGEVLKSSDDSGSPNPILSWAENYDDFEGSSHV